MINLFVYISLFCMSSPNIVKHTNNFEIFTLERNISTQMVHNSRIGVEIFLDKIVFQFPIKNKIPYTITIINKTDTLFVFGPEYIIQRYEQGKWIPPKRKSAVKDEMAWEAVRMQLEPHSSLQIPFHFFLSLFDYFPGKYRILKSITNSVSKRKYDLTVEFEIRQ